jgi:hypothetical protein
MFTVTIVVQMVELSLGRCDNKLHRPELRVASLKTGSARPILGVENNYNWCQTNTWCRE